MNILKFMICAGALGYSSLSGAGEIPNGVITQIAINRELSPAVFIKVVGTRVGAPSCASNTSWDYVLPLSTDLEKAMYSLLLAAKASQTPIRVAGAAAAACEFGVEKLTYVESK